MIFFGNTDPISVRGLPLLLVLLTIAAASLGQSSPSDKEETETVHGTVINSLTGAPIPRALVFTPDNRSAVLTDGEGHFELTLPRPDPYDAQGQRTMSFFSQSGSSLPTPRLFARLGNPFFLTARKPGFMDPLNGRTNVPPSSGDDVTIALMPEAIIKGRITLASGDAALGIDVRLYSRQVQDGLPRWTQGPTTRANSSGEFRFAELQPGSYKIVTQEFMDNDPLTNIPGSQLYGYPPVYYPGVSDFSAASTIQLTAGQEFEADLSLTRQPYYPVRIPVANNEGFGHLGISVQGQRGPGYSLGYNTIEQRIEGLLPNGNYVVEASTYGANSVNGSVTIRVTGAPLEGPAIALVPASSIRLNVKEQFADGNFSVSGTWSDGHHTYEMHGPRAYLSASLESADDFHPQQFGSLRPPRESNDDTLVLENVVPGHYWLRLHTGRGYIASATQGSTDVLHQPLTIGSGPAAPIEVTVRDDSAELDGTVTALAQPSSVNGNGPAPANVWIYCLPLPDSSGEFTQIQVSGDGKFTRPQMAPGDYRVLAFYSEQPQLPYRDPEAMKAYESKGQVVHLAAGQKANVQLQTVLND